MSDHPYLTNIQLATYDLNIDNDPQLSNDIKKDPTMREVCRCGLWMIDQLKALQCPDPYIVRIQYTAGAASFGRDPWEVHREFVRLWKEGGLEFEQNVDDLN